MGVVALPSRVTGLAAISISEEITFMPDCQGSSNSSQCDLASGVDWRFILKTTVLELAIRFQPCSNHVGPDVLVWAGERGSPGFCAGSELSHPRASLGQAGGTPALRGHYLF